MLYSSWKHIYIFIIFFGSGALSGKMLLVRFVEYNKIAAFLGQVGLIKG